MTMNRENLKEIYQKFNLDKDDIFMLKFGSIEKPIIKRCGIEKIQAQMKIEIQYKLEKISDDLKTCVVLGTGVIMTINPQNGQKTPSVGCQSFGECSPANNKNEFPVCMAEKRCLSRIVIKMAGLASHGVYGEDEAMEFTK